MKRLVNRNQCYLYFLTLVVLQWAACGAPGQKDKDTFISGEVYIAADESIEPFISTGIFNFENLNSGARIKPVFLPEALAFQAFLSDSVRAIFAGRRLNEVENAYFEKIKLIPRYTELGKDAIAFLVHPNNPDSLISIKKLNKIFKGEVSEWSELFPNANAGKITLVFDHAGSGAITALKTYFDIESLPANTYALEKNTEVVSYVNKNKGAIGIVGNNWINNLDASDLQAFNEQVKVALISSVKGNKEFVRPEQTYIADSSYAFVRTIWAINRESRVGLGSGFVSFMATDRGQRIMLKSGLLPYWMPPREIIIYD